VAPVCSLNETLARVVERIDEDANTISLWLKPNRHWQKHTPGQHLTLGVEINGRRHFRVFSVSSSPDARLLRITLRRQPGNGVTNWLHQHASQGMVFSLSQSTGDFTLAQHPSKSLLFMAAGSGITPFMAMLNSLVHNHYTGDIVLLQLCRDEQDRLFRGELADLQRHLPGLELIVHSSAEKARLPCEQLAELVPDLAERTSYLCGPSGWMEEVSAWFDTHDLSEQLHQERFSAPRPSSSKDGNTKVHANQAEHSFTQGADQTLLEAAEAAGLQPPYGCRAGLCRTCLCQKRRGTTRNLVTGIRSKQPDEWIQLCITVAESELELDL
jgi:ferredoxin-NADP reductase